jgi:Family of unknown function (DUF6496)
LGIRHSLRPLHLRDVILQNSGASRRENAEACARGKLEPSRWPTIGIVAAGEANSFQQEKKMARKTRKYSKKAQSSVERVMKKRKAGTLRSGRSGRKVRSRKQAIAIGLSEARAAGRKVPKKVSGRRKTGKSKRRSRG